MSRPHAVSSGRRATRVRVEGAVVRYGDFTAVNGVSFDVAPGELLALVGPSGCGKTSLLKAIAGLETIEAGRIEFDGTRIDTVVPHRRNVGMVFQNYALFPHKRVRENVAFGLRMHKEQDPKGERVASMLDLLHIGHLAEAWPDQLSGGQQQRVALARTLVLAPRVLLLDEPLSALDRQLRDAMRTELRTLARTVGITTILVTHDQDEAMSMADQVAVMRAGRLEQIGRPQDLYNDPASAFVASFLGRANRLAATVSGIDDEHVVARVSGGREIRVPHRNAGLQPGSELELLVRADAVTAVAADGDVQATIRDRQFMGSAVEIIAETVAGDVVRFVAGPDCESYVPGVACELRLGPHGIHAFPAEN